MMKWSKSHLFTFKEAPNDAEIASHQLLIRAGLIKKLGPGLYTYGTLALKSLRKFEAIIREELNKRDCQELLMTMVQPKEIWEETQRWEEMGDGLLKFQNRNNQDYCLGATHEEAITDYIRNDVKSYKHLPVTLYQIQTKYRDEVRPRFGLMRGREFLMKDAYSFDINQEEALKSYDRLYDAYKAIFDRLGLDYRIVEADSGSIGGSQSQEFQVLAEAGEDHLMVCDSCDYAANVEIAPAGVGLEEEFGGSKELDLEKFETPNMKTITELSKGLDIDEKHLVKTLFYADEEEKAVAILLRGCDELNPIKLKKVMGLKNEPLMLTDEEVVKLTSAKPGSCSPVGLDIAVYVDTALKSYKNFIVGANENGFHLKNTNFDRDIKITAFADLKNAKDGDSCPNCDKGKYNSFRGIEVGHCFYLGTKYTKSMNATFLDANGKAQLIEMGCYGIGVSRTIQAAIEQSHDKDGIVWPKSITPFDVHIALLDPDKEEISSVCNTIASGLEELGLEVFIDDRKERPGVKFKDADLIGLPIRIVIGGKGVENNQLEIVNRKTQEKISAPINEVVKQVQDIYSNY